jgi:hypothetical protein
MAITKINTPELFDLGSTNTSLQLPSGNTASRPSSPSTGEWRFNTDDNKVEYWDGSAWTTIEDEGIAPTPSKNFNVNTYVGSGATQTIDAQFNEAAVFNGSSSRIETGYVSNLTSASYSFWVKVTSGINERIISSLSPNPLQDAQIDVVLLTGNIVQFGLIVGGSFVSASASTALSTNVWYHIALTYSSGGFLKGYINGTEEASLSIGSLSTGSNTTALNIGYYPRFGTYELAMTFDQLRIFNTALTQQQVTDLYTNETTETAGVLNFPTGAGCVAAYQLDGDASDVGGTYGGVPTDLGFVGLKFEPDLVWVKNRTGTIYDHKWADSVRGATKIIESSTTDAEITATGSINAFNTNGFTIGTDNSVNGSGTEFVAWCWNTASSDSTNTDGSIPSTVRANQEAGFSIVKYNKSSGGTGTIGHGLSSAPEMVIVKTLDTADNWRVYHSALGGTKYLSLDTTAAAGTASSLWNNTDPTSTVVTLGIDGSVGNGNMIAYCFHSVDGYSKVGSYTGATAGVTVTTGFQPKWVMIKDTTDGVNNWVINDAARDETNPRTAVLFPNLKNAEGDNIVFGVNFLSNGFEIPSTTTSTAYNKNGNTYIYLAIAADAQPAPVLANSFEPVIYTGNGGPGTTINSQNITTSFQPDLVWIKGRDNGFSGTSGNNVLFDSVRTLSAPQFLSSNLTNASFGNTGSGVTSFNANGFTVADDGNGGGNVNGSSGGQYSNGSYVAWCWKAAGIGAINTDGSITSITNANPAAGFSIVKYKGNGSAGATFGHGLSSAPELYIIKEINGVDDWMTIADINGTYQRGKLNTTDGFSTSMSGVTNNVDPTDTVITLGNSTSVNQSGQDYIGYFFHSVTGYQKIGTYTQTSSGTLTVDTGLSGLRWVMAKGAGASGGSWLIIDTQRGNSKRLFANVNNAESTTQATSISGSTFSIPFGTTANAAGGQIGIYLAIA